VLTGSYTWDARDRLTSATAPGLSASYVYDASGRRTRQTLNSTVTKYLWDELSTYGDVVAELNASNAVTVSYVLGNGQLISQRRGSTVSYYLPDIQGSTRALTSSAAAVTDTYRYSAFGDIETQTGTTLNSYLYTGQQFDTSTGLYSLRARYYDAVVGRFMSRDTFPLNHQNPMELNRYVYTANNPITLSDPSGHESFLTTAFTYLNNLQPRQKMGMVVGGVLGGAVSAFVSYRLWDMARNGDCGPNMRDWSYSVNLNAFISASTFMGAASGAILAAMPTGAAVTFARAMGFFGAMTASVDMLFNGINACNVTALLLSLAGAQVPPSASGGLSFVVNNSAIAVSTTASVSNPLAIIGAGVASSTIFMMGDSEGETEGNVSSNNDPFQRLRSRLTTDAERELFDQNETRIRDWISHWRSGADGDVVESILYHFREHQRGRGGGSTLSLYEYMRRAAGAYNELGNSMRLDRVVSDETYIGEYLDRWVGPNGRFIITTRSNPRMIVSFGSNQPWR
jgi:RHS repeat-associated protein